MDRWGSSGTRDGALCHRGGIPSKQNILVSYIVVICYHHCQRARAGDLDNANVLSHTLLGRSPFLNFLIRPPTQLRELLPMSNSHSCPTAIYYSLAIDDIYDIN